MDLLRFPEMKGAGGNKTPRPAVRRIFVIHHGALGDLVTAFPLFGALKAAGFEIRLLCRGSIGALAASLGLARQAYALESARFASLYRENPDKAATQPVEACDIVLALTRSDSLVAGLSRFFKKPIHRIPPRPDPGARVHTAHHLLHASLKIGLIPSLEERVSAPDPDFASGENTRTLWIHPGAGSPLKRWPLDRFVETAVLLREKGFDPGFLLGPAEFFLESALSAAAPDFRIFTTGDLSALVRALKSAMGFIGNDSGVSHLAAFLGLFTVAVFGPTDPARWKPLGPAATVVQGVSDCFPCFESGNKDCRQPVCLQSVTPARVLDAFFRILPASKSAPRSA
ncbi:MAG: glycosyltransferase family 9 protein [Deltaproteobacteria bacterium]|nr:glycosyltransferase family 9 protein [Deltaproteobacteria bacterium]